MSQVLQILKPVQPLSSRFLADLKGAMLIRYADKLNFAENNKMAAVQAYDAAFDELDKDPITINDSDLRYNNDAWLELRARLSELGCR